MESETRKIHPALKEMYQLGCKNQGKLAVTFQVYMDLCEVQAMWDVQYFYNSDLELLCLTAKKSKSSPTEIFIPISVSSHITTDWIKKIQDSVCTDTESKKVTLAIKERDSSVVYYQLFQELLPPDSPEATKKKKQKEERLQYIKTEIRKQRRELFQQAQATMSETSSEESGSEVAEEESGSEVGVEEEEENHDEDEEDETASPAVVVEKVKLKNEKEESQDSVSVINLSSSDEDG